MKTVRVRFTKGDEIKYLAHLDLLRAFSRALRRSGLKIAYSQGFNPHTLTSFAMPLSVGTTSVSEYADFVFEDDVQFYEVKERLNDVLPNGIKILEAGEVNRPFSDIAFSDFELTVYPYDFDNYLNEAVRVLNLSELVMEKKSKRGLKEVDIRPFIINYEIAAGENSTVIIKLKLKSGSIESLNPRLIIGAIEKYGKNAACEYYKIQRKSLYCQEVGDLIV